MVSESESDLMMTPQETGSIVKFGHMAAPKKLGITPVNQGAAVGRTNKENN
jgi:hypothetical protein